LTSTKRPRRAASTGAPAPSGLSADEKHAYDQLVVTYQNVGYGVYLGWHPQTHVGLADSPASLAALLLDHDKVSHELIIRSFNGQVEGLTRDDILDNISLFWFTNTGFRRLVSIGRTSCRTSP
jgi:hypothetical protein